MAAWANREEVLRSILCLNHHMVGHKNSSTDSSQRSVSLGILSPALAINRYLGDRKSTYDPFSLIISQSPFLIFPLRGFPDNGVACKGVSKVYYQLRKKKKENPKTPGVFCIEFGSYCCNLTSLFSFHQERRLTICLNTSFPSHHDFAASVIYPLSCVFCGVNSLRWLGLFFYT